MRKLASIQKIKEILPIEGADAIELAIVNGWKVVVAKNVGHQVGDFVVYCEIDSFLPIEPEFEFLRKSSYKKMGDQEGFRLRSVKIRGVVSQGLILPLSVLESKSGGKIIKNKLVLKEGDDVTDLLGILKYEPPIPADLAGKVKGQFPGFIPKTDEERIQNLPEEFEEWKNLPENSFYVTEKLDGSSATYYYKEGEFGVCSRNLELLETEGNTFWKVAREMKLEEKLAVLGKNVSVQGELIGEGIQSNPYKIKGQTVKFFNAFDIDSHEYFNLPMFRILIEETLELETVPILHLNFTLLESIEDILQMAEGKSSLNEKTEREGLVIRSHDRTISFKAISNKFLLKEK